MPQEVDGFSGYIVLKKAAKLSGISPMVLRKRIERGRLHAVKVETILMVKLSDVRAAKDDDRRCKQVRRS